MSTAVRRTLFEKRATADGTYWVSPAAPAAVRHFLRGLAADRFKSAADAAAWNARDPELRKYASIGGEQEQGFEQAFSSLAYAYLKDKSPRLIDFIVGFQLVDRNEDNTKAVGVFGFKVGDQWLYCPVFFLNGDLKGHELLYVKKQDAFVPMKENWVNYLISHRPHVLGEGSPQTTHQLGGLMPNMHRLRRPGGIKYGADAAPHAVAGWAAPVLPLLFALGTARAAALYEKAAGDLDMRAVVAAPFAAALAPTAARFDLRAALADFPLLKAAYETAYRAYPLVKAGFDRFYGREFFPAAAAAARADAGSLVKRAESYISPPRDRGRRVKKPFSISLFDDPPAKEKNAGLYVYALDVAEDAPGGLSANKPELTAEEREKLLRDTVLIKDERDDTETSIAYNTQVRLELVNPSETGLYEVLEKPGSFARMVVIANPQTGRGREDFCLVLRKDSPRNWKNTHRTNLWAKSCDCPTPEDWREYVDGLGGLDSLEKGGTYVAVHANGSGTCPFRVREAYGDGSYAVEWLDSCAYSDRSPTTPKRERSWDWEVGYTPWDAKVHVNARKGSGLRSVNGELSIPDAYKVIKVSDPPKPRKADKGDLVDGCLPAAECCPGASADDPIRPGSLIDVQLALYKQAAEVRVHDTGSAVAIRGPLGLQQLGKTAALVSLVRDHGLRECQALEMLKEAAALRVHNRAAAFLVKYAEPYSNLQPGPGAPAVPEAYYGTEPVGYGSVNAIYPQEEYLPVDEMSSRQADPSVYDPFYQPDQGAMQVAQQASQSGQKEVFDTAMIGGMLKAVRQDSLVDRYLGDLMKALDKLGRILFMFYWHQEEFEDRYGKQDLPELEDSLRNAFEVLGDVVLFLKEKTVGGGPGALNSTGVGAVDAGEPNIQEAARN